MQGSNTKAKGQGNLELFVLTTQRNTSSLQPTELPLPFTFAKKNAEPQIWVRFEVSKGPREKIS